MGDEWIESIPVQEDLGVLVNKNLDLRQQCALGTWKARPASEVWQRGQGRE